MKIINGGDAMNQKIRLNIPELKRIVTDRYDGNKAAFAKAPSVSAWTLKTLLLCPKT